MRPAAPLHTTVPGRTHHARTRKIAAVLIMLVASAPVSASAAGLFTRLYGDRRASRVGDSLHLLIVESTKASMQTAQDTKQNTDSKIGPGIGKLKFLPLMGFEGKTGSSASGSSSRTGTVTARMTVRVTEVTDAGNLVVQGEREVNVNKDKEIIRITGEVRIKDIRPNNTVYSYDVADVQIDFIGSDPRKPKRKVGLVTRLLNLFF